jgi:hypothetical protein
MKSTLYTYGTRPKAIYYLSNIKSEIFPNHSFEDFYREIDTKWLTNPDIVIIDDRGVIPTKPELDLNQLEKYLQKLEEIKKSLDDE